MKEKKKAGRPKSKNNDLIRNINFPFAINKAEKAYLKEQSETLTKELRKQGLDINVSIAAYIRKKLFADMPKEDKE